MIVLEPGSARGIRLVEQLGLPLIGSVAAGSPILAVENVQGRYALDASLFKPRADFLLRVRGLSTVSYTHLDVYKRQVPDSVILMRQRLSLPPRGPLMSERRTAIARTSSLAQLRANCKRHSVCSRKCSVRPSPLA